MTSTALYVLVDEYLVAALRLARRILGANECGTDDVLGPIDELLAKLGETA